MADSKVERPSVATVLAGIRDTLTTKAILGEPVVTDDVTLVPVHRVSGMGCQCRGCGGCGGRGCGCGDSKKHDDHADSDAEGCSGGADKRGGVGACVRSKPIGAFAIRGKDVEWHPVMDMNKVILGGQLVGVAALLVIGALIRGHAAHKKKPCRKA